MILPKIKFSNIKNLRLVPKQNNNKIGGMSFFDYLGKVKEQKFTFNDPKPAPYTKRLKEQVSNIIGKNSLYQEQEQSIHQLMESLPAQSQQQMLSWLRQGEDLGDIENALQISSKQHNFKADNKISTSEFIQKFVDKTKGNYRPEEHPEYLTFVRELPDGSKIYDVKDSEDAARHLSDLIYAQRGDSPWCVLHKDNDGNWMPNMWNHYTGIKRADGSVARQALFNPSGELVSFNASESKNPIWWDLADRPQGPGIIKTVTNYPTHRRTRSFNLETNTWEGNPENMVVRGNPKRGLYIKGTDSQYTVQGNDGKIRDNGTIRLNQSEEDDVIYHHETGEFEYLDPIQRRGLISTPSHRPTKKYESIWANNPGFVTIETSNQNLRLAVSDTGDLLEVHYKTPSGVNYIKSGDLETITLEHSESYLKEISKESIRFNATHADPFGIDENVLQSAQFDKIKNIGEAIYGGGHTKQISKSEFDKLAKPYRQKLRLAHDQAQQAVKESKFQDFGHTVIDPSDWRQWAETTATQFRKGGIMNYLNYITSDINQN